MGEMIGTRAGWVMSLKSWRCWDADAGNPFLSRVLYFIICGCCILSMGFKWVHVIEWSLKTLTLVSLSRTSFKFRDFWDVIPCSLVDGWYYVGVNHLQNRSMTTATLKIAGVNTQVSKKLFLCYGTGGLIFVFTCATSPYLYPHCHWLLGGAPKVNTYLKNRRPLVL